MPDEADPLDFSNRFNTPLKPEEEGKFRDWLAGESQRRKRDMSGDLYDYDLRGLWKTKGGFDARGHATDEFKKPNHPTFSTESRYNGVGTYKGGQWTKDGGSWAFQAGPTNLQMRSAEDLADYFRRFEPGVKLALPK